MNKVERLMFQLFSKFQILLSCILLLDKDNLVLSLSQDDSKENSKEFKDDSKDHGKPIDKPIDPHKGKYIEVKIQLLAIHREKCILYSSKYYLF